MTIIQMQYFYEVCRCGNITKAALNLHVSQPTVSVAMQTLEKETGLSLFRHDGRKIYLTQDAHALLAKIHPILEGIDELDRDISDLSHKKSHIRIAMPPQSSPRFTPLLLGRFRREHPEIELEIIEDAPVDALHLLKNDDLDVVLMHITKETGDFTCQKLGHIECCFCTCWDNALAGRAAVTIEDIKDEPLALVGSNFPLTRRILQQFSDAGVKPKVLHYSPSLYTILNLVEQRIASTFLVRPAILPQPCLVPIPLDPPLFLETGFVMKKGRPMHAKERTLFRFMKENLS